MSNKRHEPKSAEFIADAILRGWKQGGEGGDHRVGLDRATSELAAAKRRVEALEIVVRRLEES